MRQVRGTRTRFFASRGILFVLALPRVVGAQSRLTVRSCGCQHILVFMLPPFSFRHHAQALRLSGGQLSASGLCDAEENDWDCKGMASRFAFWKLPNAKRFGRLSRYPRLHSQSNPPAFSRWSLRSRIRTQRSSGLHSLAGTKSEMNPVSPPAGPGNLERLLIDEHARPAADKPAGAG